MRWFGLRLLWLLGYLWMAPLFLAGFAVLFWFELWGRVTWSRFAGPAYLVRVDGKFAEWMFGRDWYGHTLGPVCFFWAHDPDQQETTHEGRHVWQQMVFGVFDVLIYVIGWLIGFVRTGSTFEAYRQTWLERDARRVAGEPE
jgi:hypothetical protein